MQIMSLKIQKDKIKEDLKNLQNQEAVLAKELEEKYGKGSISLESREFLPTEQTFKKNYHIYHKNIIKWQKL